VSAQLAFESGEADGIWMPGGGPQLIHDLTPKGFVPDKFPGLSFNLIPSSGNPDSPWSYVKVRQAADYAIDKVGISTSILYGISTPMYQIACKYQAPYDPDLEKRAFDKAKALQLMEEAGYADGFDTNIYVGEQLNGNHIPAIQANLQAVGIRASIQVVSVGKWIDMETNGWDEGVVYSPQGAGPFGQFVQRYWIRPTFANWSSGIYWTALYRPAAQDAIIDSYLKEPTDAGQIDLGKQLTKLYYDEAVVINLWEGPDAYMLTTKVHDTKFGLNGIGGEFDYLNAWMEK
jgi:peptide/nickel transport system substrate-binding protein